MAPLNLFNLDSYINLIPVGIKPFPELILTWDYLYRSQCNFKAICEIKCTKSFFKYFNAPGMRRGVNSNMHLRCRQNFKIIVFAVSYYLDHDIVLSKCVNNWKNIISQDNTIPRVHPWGDTVMNRQGYCVSFAVLLHTQIQWKWLLKYIPSSL